MKITSVTKTKGFNLIEVSITLVLTSLIAQTLMSEFQTIQTRRLIFNEKTELVLLADQVTRVMRQAISKAGIYNQFDDNNKLIDKRLAEQKQITNNAIVRPNTLVKAMDLGSLDSKSDALVLSVQATVGCNGQKFNYQNDELFYAINQYYFEADELRCKSYDGRYLTGEQTTSKRSISVSIMPGVLSMQVKYLVWQESAFSWLDASKLSENMVVQAVKMEFILASTLRSTSKLFNPSWFLFHHKELVPQAKLTASLLLTIPLLTG